MRAGGLRATHTRARLREWRRGEGARAVGELWKRTNGNDRILHWDLDIRRRFFTKIDFSNKLFRDGRRTQR
jgi:hypothetical protein